MYKKRHVAAVFAQMSVRTRTPRQPTTAARPLLLSYTSATGSNFRLVDRPMVANTASGYMPVYPAHLQSHLDSPYVTSTAAPYRMTASRYYSPEMPVRMTASRYYNSPETPARMTASRYYSPETPYTQAYYNSVPQTQAGWAMNPFHVAGEEDDMSDAFTKTAYNAGTAALLSGGLTAGIYAQSHFTQHPQGGT